MTLLFGNVLTWLCPLFLFFVLDRLFILSEEQKTAESFGNDYFEYERSVRHWL